MKSYATNRVVLWWSGTSEAVCAAWWAAWYAAKRAVPLHILSLPGIHGLGAESSREGETVTVVEALGALHDHYPDLSVTTQNVQGDRDRADDTLLAPGDVLVLATRDAEAPALRAPSDSPLRVRVSVPMVIVPVGAMPGGPSGPKVLLLTDPHAAPAAAEFAFATAKSPGAPVDAVHMQKREETHAAELEGSGGMVDSSVPADSRLRADLARLQDRFPDVRLVRVTLRMGSRATLRTLARATCLAVVGQRTDPDELIRTVLDVGVSPVAVVPEPERETESSYGSAGWPTTSGRRQVPPGVEQSV